MAASRHAREGANATALVFDAPPSAIAKAAVLITIVMNNSTYSSNHSACQVVFIVIVIIRVILYCILNIEIHTVAYSMLSSQMSPND